MPTQWFIKIILVSTSSIICLGLGMFVVDLKNFSSSEHVNSLQLLSAQARETLAERRARIREDRRLRKLRKEGKNLEEEQAVLDTKTIAEQEAEANKPGPKKFTQEMIDMMRVEGEKTEAELAVEKQLKEEQAKQEAEAKLAAEQAEQETTRSRRKKRERKPRNRRAAKEEATQTQAMRGEVYTRLENAQQLFQAKDFKAALAILDELTALTGRKALQEYEKANVLNFYGFIYYSQEKYAEAVKAYQRVLQQPNLPKAMADKTQYTLAQLHMVREDYPAAIAAFEKWFTTAEKVGPNAHATLAQAYVQVKNYDKALYRMKKTLQAAHAQGKRPKEQWYEVLRFLYSEKGDTKAQMKVVRLLLEHWPKRKYWLGLAGLYGQMNNMERQMQILNTLYVQGGLERESEIISLAQMFAAAEVPYKAAKILQKALKEKKIKSNNDNLARVGEYWRQAQEMDKALPMLESASQKAPDGKSSERLAYIYYDLGKFQESANAAARAIAKGGLRDINNVRMLMGQALFNVEKFDEAASAFKRVSLTTNDERIKATASQWMNFMQREKVRVQEVKQYLGSS